jgi:transposase
MRYKPLSIEEQGGLATHMKLKGYNYDEFNKRMELKEPTSIIARALGVSRTTCYKWSRVWNSERKHVDE